jgi:ParB-like chromosome segregation protein Spo0J
MWTRSPDAALQIATGLHRERIARAEQIRLARRGRESPAATAPQPLHRPFSRLIDSIGRAAATIRRGSTERGGCMPVPCPTGTC